MTTLGNNISGAVLAGGAGRRMGGVDKGFVTWRGEPLIIHALRLVAGLPEVLISANRSLERYRALAPTVIVDDTPHFAGPLSGLRQILRCAHQPWVAVVPVDSPRLPADLVARLWAARAAAQVVIGRSPHGPEPVICLCQRAVLPTLEAYVAAGGTRAQDWFQPLAHTWLDLTKAEVANCNDPADLDT
ncbi:MAG: molybdenum cofactor guanylyltransferase MobA [Acidiferrobacter sp.]